MNYSLSKLLLIGMLLEITILGVCYFLHVEIGETFRFAARYSGRLSAFVFLVAFYLFAVSHPTPIESNTPLRNWITLFAVLHVIHFGFLVANVYLNDIPIVPVKLAGGALAYLMIVVAPFKLHKLTFKVQLIYFYYVALVMIITYVARVKGDFEGTEPFWFHYLMIGVLVVCCVVFGYWMRRSRN